MTDRKIPKINPSRKLTVFAKHKNEIALVTKMLDTLDELKKEIYKQKMIEDSVNSQLIESRVKCIKRKRGSR